MSTKVDLSGVPIKLRKIAANPELGKVASAEAARLANKYVPMRTGDLARSADVSQPWRIKYTMPYARRLYYGDGFSFSKEEHPQARSRWDQGINKAALAKKISKAAKEL